MSLVFDGHNDVLTRLWLSDSPNPAQAFLQQRLAGEMDLQRCQTAGFAGGLFAIFVPPFEYVQQHVPHKLANPQADQFSQQDMQNICLKQLAILQEIVTDPNQQVKLCTSSAEIRQCIEQQKLAVVLHLEGAEAIAEDLELLDVLYQAGLRSIGPLWNRQSLFGHGLKAAFPHSPNTGAGLTDLGKQLVKRCAELRMVVDVSHMNERAFWDTAELLQQPMVATHSNAHTLCPQARNLTDHQLKAFQETQGMIGVNFDTAFLRADGQRNRQTSLDVILDHIEYLMAHVGEAHVGFGSDFDGGFISQELEDVTGLPKIVQHMQRRGYSENLIHQLCRENWLNALERIWGK